MQEQDNMVVAYGYQQRFNITRSEAETLLKARQDGIEVIRFDGFRVLGTNFSWIAPSEETGERNLDLDETRFAIKVAKWLAKPVHNLDFDDDSAFNYVRKLIKRIGLDEVYNLWNTHAIGAYPSASKFMSKAKESQLDDKMDKKMDMYEKRIQDILC